MTDAHEETTICEPREENYIDLIVAIIKQAIEEEGIGYVDTDGGKYWCDLAGIDIEYIKRAYEIHEKHPDWKPFTSHVHLMTSKRTLTPDTDAQIADIEREWLTPDTKLDN
jgi:hypothetical protein